MITYGDFPLIVPDERMVLLNFQDAFQPMLNLREFGKNPVATMSVSRLSTNSPGCVGPPRPNYPGIPEIGINQLYWPTGASRWSFGHFIAHDDEKKAIVKAAHTDPTSPKALTLKMGEDKGAFIKPEMFLLPPRPLTVKTSGNAGWLLTLVDVRYFWQLKEVGDLLPTETTTWDALFDLLLAAVDETSVTKDTVDADYLNPDKTQFTRFCDNPAILLDAATHSVGQRLVRRIDGQVTLMNFTTADALATDNLDSPEDSWTRIAGDSFDDEIGDLPRTVKVCFPKIADHVPDCDCAVFAISKDPADLALDFPLFNTTVSDATKVFHSACYAELTAGGSPSNLSKLTPLAEQIATDYYKQFERRFDYTFNGIKLWDPTSYDDHTLYSFGRQRPDKSYDVTTRVQSVPLNFGIDDQLSQDTDIRVIDRFYQNGKADADIASGGSGLISIFTGTAGSETDSTLNVTAFDWLGAGAQSGERVKLWFDCDINAWYFLPQSALSSIDLCCDLCEYFKMDASSGDIIDATKNKHNGVDQGAIGTASGLIVGSRVFGASSSDYALWAHQDCMSIQKGGTIAGWMKTSTLPTVLTTLFGKKPGGVTTNNGEWALFYGPPSGVAPAICAQFTHPTASNPTECVLESTAGVDLDDGSFHFIALVVKKLTATTSEIFIRIDNFKSTPVTITFVPPAPTQQLSAGALSDGTSLYVGELDEWGLWDRELSTAELDFLFNNGSGRSFPFGDLCCDAKTHTDPRSVDRYSVNEVAEGETVAIGPRRQMTVHGGIIIDGSLQVDGSLVLEA